MPTPTTAFVDAAAKFGNVDPNDLDAVQRWFSRELPTLPADVIQQVLEDLLAHDGASATRELIASYPDRAPLPSLRASPEALPPLLAQRWRHILRRWVARMTRR